MSAERNDNLSETTQYVTVHIGGQLFGLPISRVHDVFRPDSMARVPLASKEIAGVLNLRGRIVTAIDMRRRLDLKSSGKPQEGMAVGVEHRGESYGLIVDSVGEVLTLPDAGREASPANLDRRWAEVSAGVHRLEGHLMVILDVVKVLGSMIEPKAA